MDFTQRLRRQSIVLGLFSQLMLGMTISDFRYALPFTFILKKCSGKRKVILLDNRQFLNHLK